MEDKTTGQSTFAVVANALGWTTDTYKEDDGLHVEVSYGLDPIMYSKQDGREEPMSFVGDDPWKIARKMDDLLKDPIQATCWPEDLTPPQSWNLPGFPTPEDAAMRVSLGQHKSWRTG